MDAKGILVKIHGLICEADAESLRRYVQMTEGVYGCLVEVGCWMGCSTIEILEADSRGRTMFCFDVFPDFQKWKKNIAQYAPTAMCVCPVVGDMHKTLPKWTPELISFAFIDHDHTLKSTKLCYDVLWPNLSTGGIMAFHDYNHSDYPEPKPFFDSLPHEVVEKRDGIVAFIKR